MTAKEYILERLEGIKKIQSQKPTGDLVNFICTRIMSKKFRKFSINQEVKDMIRTAVELNIKNKEPIKLVVSAGAYKLWRFKESPEPDWAELFTMIYYAYWLKPITDIYKPGIWFDFCGEDAILELMNNIPREDTEEYKKVFRELLKLMRTYLPENFKMTFSPTGERYSSEEEFLEDLKDKMDKLKKAGEIELDDKKIRSAKSNIKPGKEEINFEENRLLHDAYMKVDKKRSYYKKPEKIFICSKPYGGIAVPVGTTKTSVVQWQVGIGALKRQGDSFIEYALSLSQVEKFKPTYKPISIDGLNGKNFSKIKILEEN
jgi:hypothetical protein